MKTSISFANTLLCCLLLMITHQLAAQSFIHPGLLHTEADFARMRTKVNAGAQPWKGSWDILVANGRSQLNWTARPVDTVRRGGDRQNYSQLMNDIAAAYQTALRWKITGDVAYANKSIEIMNAWSSTLQQVTGNADRFLAAGIYGYEFANAAEIMRTYSGWASADFERFRNMLLTKFYPLSDDFLNNHNGACITNYWANWDLCNMAFILSLGVLCDRRDLYNRAIDYFKNGAGNGSITHAVWYLHSSTLGQWQESGRDQGHCTLGIGLMGAFCEMAWNQGDDMYGYDSNRFMKGAEYVAQYNNGDSVPYVTYNWGTGQNCAASSQTVISASARGNIRPVWEMVYNHYANRMGLSVPAMAAFAAIQRPEGGGGNYGTTSGGFDQLGFGSLTFTRDPLPDGGPANGTYKIFARHSAKAMDVANNGTANGTNVRQWTSNDCACQQWVITSTGNSQYTIVGVGSGKNLDVNGAGTADGANVQIWQSTGANNQRFTFTPAGGGFYRITPVHSGKAVDVNAGALTDGANIQQWTYNSGKNQQWQLVPVSSAAARLAMPLTKEINYNSDSLSVYPNPPVNNVTVNIPASLAKGQAVITLSDLTGRVLYQGRETSRKHIIDLSSVVPGVYFITVSNGREKITRKIIK
ncbi:Por secretion system C-terminal sorting domain-containing protein [Chitinophaga rupis]|uniref:Por secretion system C-terminal sorting domain-containing protein n=1 Tax=Chitinophaga rupis TaxID=573321 RepID=A0A1H7ZJ43_9BACT|nr:RICIN domain-containing protein [Chitinophaga rupis]SEM58430.1 Por secretion system C-terminal sorting domain-containing protein [Chitinophaga rupis]